jgi:hypothetical protein
MKSNMTPPNLPDLSLGHAISKGAMFLAMFAFALVALFLFMGVVTTVALNAFIFPIFFQQLDLLSWQEGTGIFLTIWFLRITTGRSK